MINYNNNDLVIYPLYKAIIEKIEADEVTDEDVWDEARGYSSIPNFEKILLELSEERISERLSELFEEWYPEEETALESLKFKFEINGSASFISINNDEISDLSDFVQAINVNGGLL